MKDFIKVRIDFLKKLKENLIKYQEDIYQALYLDLNKSKIESEMTELALIFKEINLFIKKINKWSKPKRVASPIYLLFSKSKIHYQPYGKVLIISPWNYPFNLTFIPLINAFAAGNQVVIKPSEYSTHSSNLINKIISETFDAKDVSVVLGDSVVASNLVQQKWDFIFFTGNNKIGQIVYQEAAKQMIPCVMELGGKSPVIVDQSANLKSSAKKIVWAKMINSGQTCVAPDFILVHNSIKNQLIKLLQQEYIDQFGSNSLKNPYLPKIISSRHYQRILSLKDDLIKDDINQKIDLKVYESNWEDPLMQQEIFGPILPIIGYDDINDIWNKINSLEPLVVYLFSKNKQLINLFINNFKTGSVCINDILVQLSNHNYGFGGYGKSGFGQYHGYQGFLTFSHPKTVFKTKDNPFDKVRFFHKNHNDITLKFLKKILRK
ncbi:aldehyde dehydrogenase family protein [Mycoplasma sp. NEAQ87857]|uniref:aldehyde dehydrogenase family protein n=1 Tax=Mycoplasma sp. NEAQ87857 TaxID=2683967 RepID=UPI001316E0EF|nr:aldehyde dehydrogenase family protein [Mycoplasma sp. NEAQ87857]QGZ97921.1 aldehyde dehydrogenase family protein [Mycoplasma sp. NEAQ87857]